ncbi:Supervillin [Nymphon striatum]|nr:Supervillin [Nymphon striatum]
MCARSPAPGAQGLNVAHRFTDKLIFLKDWGWRNSTNYNYANIMMKVREETPYIVDAGPGLKQRLASLQKSQEDGWKERLRTIKNDDPEKEIAVILPVKKSSEIFESKSKESKAKLRVKEEGTPKARPNSIADRLHLLESSKKEWQKRIEKSDAEQYTVAGKMGASPGNVTPVSQRKRQVPELQIFRSKTDDINRLKSLGAVSLFPVSPLIPNIEISKSKSTTNAVRKEDSSDSENDENDPASIFMQPMSFNVSSASSKEEHLQINEDSFSSFLLQTAKSSDKLHVEHRTVKAQRNQVTSGNPIRKLASRSDLSYSYKEEKKNHAENEWKKIKIESMSKSTTLANSALAGLASIEDFASVSLRKVNSNENIAGTNSLCPYKDKMLLQVKGRRIIQTRMVEPKASSVNKGDCFILVVPDAIYQYIGKLSNVIEKSKSADIVSVIKSKKDLGFRNSLKDAIILDDESSISKENEKQFRSLLDSEDARSLAQEAGPPEDDELYETSIVSTNKVYEVDDTSLVPCEEYWGTSLNYEMLKPEKVFVFDFGSEMYVWHGKLSPSDQRRISSQLAKELWSQGYDYSKCDINPVYPTSQKESQKCCKERPDWALLCKVNQHMETILFKEKFFNWPNEDAKQWGGTAMTLMLVSSDSSSNKITEMVACDVIEMINTPFPEVDLVLEMSHLGRGLEFHDTNERRMFEIETRGIQVWHAQEFGTEKLCEGSWGQFHSGDTYVVHQNTNKVGRDRCAYFFWQGRDSSINEKGACALMTVELDEERGPHVRVIQGKEPPCFLNIFKGSLITHKHKRNNPNSFKRGEWRLFIVLGEEPSEAMLVEVDCDISCLRSRAIFMLIHTTTCDVYMWYGSKISKIHRAVARAAIDNLKTKKPSEMHFCNKSLITVHREHEGNESDGFFKGIGSSDVKKYFSLLSDKRLFQYTMRVYRLTSVSGTFSSLEMLCPFRKNENPCAFPIVQADLYKVAQPALFLIDNNTEIFLWQGWHPENNSCPKNRWNKERLCAMETCMTYCKEKQLEESKVVLISAGHEPLDFKNLFPEWIEDWNKEIDDVDKVFEMTKEEFYEKPSWKQLELRKATNLKKKTEFIYPVIIFFVLGSLVCSKDKFKLTRKHNHEEADTLIPLHCLNAASSKPGCSIDVFTVDTDVYVLLIYIFSFLLPPCKLYMHAGRGKSYRVLDIEESCRKIGSRKCNALLGMHAFTGSDWGGKFSGITKRKWMKLFLELDDSDEILDLILVLGISSPVGHGWEDKDTSIMPIMCLKSPAPQALLELIKCGCKGKCDKRQCSCLRNNLHCTPACLCGDCHNQDDAEKSADDGIGDESSSDETGDEEF